MLFASNVKIALIAMAGFAPLATTAVLPDRNRDITAFKNEPALIEIAPGSVHYRVAGDFTRSGNPTEAPLVAIRITQPLVIMKHQVSGADFQRCVTDKVCRTNSPDVPVTADRPIVMVSWRDAP